LFELKQHNTAEAKLHDVYR